MFRARGFAHLRTYGGHATATFPRPCNVANPIPATDLVPAYLVHGTDSCSVINLAPERFWYMLNVMNLTPERSWYMFHVTRILVFVTRHKSCPGTILVPFQSHKSSLGTILVFVKRRKSCPGTILLLDHIAASHRSIPLPNQDN